MDALVRADKAESELLGGNISLTKPTGYDVDAVLKQKRSKNQEMDATVEALRSGYYKMDMLAEIAHRGFYVLSTRLVAA
jgi:hypothetical protein